MWGRGGIPIEKPKCYVRGRLVSIQDLELGSHVDCKVIC